MSAFSPGAHDFPCDTSCQALQLGVLRNDLKKKYLHSFNGIKIVVSNEDQGAVTIWQPWSECHPFYVVDINTE
jgi:hypothetical protein